MIYRTIIVIGENKNYSNVVFSIDGGNKSSKIIQFKIEVYIIDLNIYRKIFKAIKGVWRMPRRQEAMKDVVSCDKLRRAAHKRYIRRFPNGTT